MITNARMGEEVVMESIAQEKIINAINYLLAQSGECDGYLSCAVIRHDGMPMVVGEMFRDLEGLIEWYERRQAK